MLLSLCADRPTRFLLATALFLAQPSPSLAQAPVAASPADLEPTDEDESLDETPTSRPSSSKTLSPPIGDHAARTKWLRAQLDDAIKLRGALNVGAIVLLDDVVVWEHNSDAPLSLASNAKLFTALAALRVLGPGYRYATELRIDAQDLAADGALRGPLYVIGTGDPSLTASDADELVKTVWARGVRKVRAVVLDDDAYANTQLPPHYDEQPNEQAAFRAPTSALSFDQNAITVEVIPTKQGEAAIVRTTPDVGKLVRISGTIQTTTTSKTQTHIKLNDKGAAWELRISGQILQADGVVRRRLRAPDARKFAGFVLLRALAKQGIKVEQRGVAFRPTPAKTIIIASRTSDTLASLLRTMNKFSSNFYADMIFKSMATGPRRSWEGAAATVRRELVACGVQGSFRLDNGSGLFGATSASARQLASALGCASRTPESATDFVASLAHSGNDGTLQQRDQWRHRVRAKTGTLASVSSLAGYVMRRGSPLVFAIVINGVPSGQTAMARKLQDVLVGNMIAADL